MTVGLLTAAVIGGADGPTAIFLAGRLGLVGWVIRAAVLIGIIWCVVVTVRKRRKSGK